MFKIRPKVPDRAPSTLLVILLLLAESAILKNSIIGYKLLQLLVQI
jgi:hypothetical protein